MLIGFICKPFQKLGTLSNTWCCWDLYFYNTHRRNFSPRTEQKDKYSFLIDFVSSERANDIGKNK